MRKFLKIFVTLFFFFPFIILGQKTTVTGVINDKVFKEALPFVNVYFNDTKIGTITDIDGRFSLSSYYGTDTLVISFIGYKTEKVKILKDKKQNINISLQELSTSLEEITVTPSDINPAHPIINKVLKNKLINNREKLQSYEYETYNKIQLDINNFTNDLKNVKTFNKIDFVFNHLDSSRAKSALPFFISENISNFYYNRDPFKTKEIIKAAKVSGVENTSFMELTGEMYQQVNVYDNQISVFGKNFTSPINKNCLSHYKFYLIDSLFVDNNWCYQIDFTPKRKGELTFDGTLWINDTTYAIKKVKGYINKTANINFINELEITQIFEQVEPEIWMLKKDELFVDFEWVEKGLGVYANKNTFYSDFIINNPRNNVFFNTDNKISISDTATNKSDLYWKLNRHETLSKKEEFIYNMVDSLKEVPVIKTYADIIQTLATGYKVIGKFEIGEYTSLYTFNEVEGNRFRLALRTSNDFSKMVEFSGFGAYGLSDEMYKYGIGTRFFITKKPRRMIHAIFKNDVEQFGLSSNAFNNTGIVSSYFRRNPFNKLLLNEQFQISYNRFWEKGLSAYLLFRHSDLSPLGILAFIDNKDQILSSTIATNEISLKLRLAIGEEFLSGEYDRISLGTKHPIVSIDFTNSIAGFWNSDLNYQKLKLEFSHKIKLPILGEFEYQLIGGKIWGDVPFPLLEIHPGNETWSFNSIAFNMMNIGEFISDRYISFKAEHHFDGLFLNKFPLIEKLQIREIAGLKGVYGNLSNSHENILSLPNFSSSLQKKPYLETYLGLENIFKFIRLDFIWRLSYLDNRFDGIKVSPFGVRGSLQFDF